MDHWFGYKIDVFSQEERKESIESSKCLGLLFETWVPWASLTVFENQVGKQNGKKGMSQNYPLADLLTTIRNGQKARLGEVKHMNTKLGRGLLKVFLQEGAISHYSISPRNLHIQLKYPQNEPAFSTLKTL